MDKVKQAKWRFKTKQVRSGLQRSGFSETSEAIFMNSGFIYDSALEAEQSFDGTLDRMVYSRFKNPTVKMLEDRLAAIEGAEQCMATASGMAAVHAALMCQLKAGDRVVAAKAIFGSCNWIIAELLPRFGISTCFVDGTDHEGWMRALSQPTTAVFIESPANPTLEIIDIKMVAELTHQAGGRLIVDNVFATPLLQSPLRLGADIVVYSTTKHIDGQGRTLGGAILGTEQFCSELLMPFLRHTGPCLSAFNAWIQLKGLETLDLRVRAACDSALKIALFLEKHPALKKVRYPGLNSHPQYMLIQKQMKGFGTILALELKNGQDAAYQLMDRLNIIDISNNLGDAKSLICHPWTTTHQRVSESDKLAMGITKGLLRLSVGLEDPQDLIEDLDQAL